jgi:integrase
MNLSKHGRRIDLSYSFAGTRIHRSWPDKETLHRELEALFWLRDHRIDLADLCKVQASTGKLPNLQNVGTKGPITFLEFIRERYYRQRMSMISPNSRERETFRLQQLIAEFGDKMLHDMDGEMIEDFRMRYPSLKKTKKVRPASAASALNHMIKPLKAAFKMAVAWGFLRTNSLRDVKLMKEPPGRDQYIPSIDAFTALYTRASEELKPWLIFGLYTGLRKSAICALTRNDIDHEARELKVRNSKGRTYRVYLHDEVMQCLESLGPSVSDARILRTGDDKPAPFPERDFRHARKLAGLGELHFHDLRHTP